MSHAKQLVISMKQCK